MKKVLIITTISGFLYQFEKENVKILQGMGYEVHYAANTENQNYIYDESVIKELGLHMHHIDIVKSPYRLRINRKALSELTDIIRREQIGLIHCHTPVGGMLGRLAGKKCRDLNVQVIYTTHGFHFYQGAPFPDSFVYRLAEKWLAGYTDTLIVINDEDYRNAQKFHLRPDGQVYQIPGVGVDMEQFRPYTKAERASSRKRLGIKDEFFLLAVGELNKNKNEHAILLALSKLKKEGIDSSRIRCGICGDGIYRQKMEAWVRELDLEEMVTLYGYINPIQPMLGAADALIFPSRREGLGMGALEALSMGIPVIASDNRGTREYMEHEKNGYVCAWNDVNGYVCGIKKMMSLSESERNGMREYCRQSVRRFEKSNTNKIMKEIYHRMDEKNEVRS